MKTLTVELIDKGMLFTIFTNMEKGHHSSIYYCKHLTCDITDGGGIRIQGRRDNDTPIDILYNGRYMVVRDPDENL